jgi:hypothetical protein
MSGLGLLVFERAFQVPDVGAFFPDLSLVEVDRVLCGGRRVTTTRRCGIPVLRFDCSEGERRLILRLSLGVERAERDAQKLGCARN